MKKFQLILTAIITFTFYSCAQDTIIEKKGYTVNPSISKKIRELEITKGQAQLKMEWMVEGKPFKYPLLTGELPCYSFCHYENDTTKVDIYTMFGMIGLRIFFYKDSAWLFHFISSKDRDLKSFKKSPQDKEYRFSPDIGPEKFKLILVSNPTTGIPPAGYIEFESLEYYQKGELTDKKTIFKATGYFLAEKRF